MGAYSGPKTTTSGLIFAYDMGDYASWKGAPTTNLIPSGTINSYPSVGNTHGTFSTNQYNSNTFFDIGTIGSVTGNLVTLSAVDHAIYTYDILTPETTGGGVTAGIYYQVQNHSTTTFSLHTPDTTNDGSKGFGAYDDIASDTRLSINATSFPISWKGPPHRPNAALVKEIIPDGFEYNGRTHDCIRLHTEHKPNAFDDYMAYGCLPPVVNTQNYAYGFKFRAANSYSVGTTLGFSLHTSPTSWGGSTSAASTLEWQQHSATAAAPATGNTNMYFSASGTGSTMELSEIQFEDGTILSEFQPGTGARSNTEALIDLTGNSTITATSLTYASDNTFSFVSGSSNAISIPLSTALNKQTGSMNFWAYPTSYNGGNGYFVNRDSSTTNALDWLWIGTYSSGSILYFRLGNGATCCSQDLTVSSWSTSYAPVDTWINLCVTWLEDGTSVIYVNGAYVTSRAIGTIPATNPTATGRIGLGHASGDTYFNGKIAITQIYNRQLTASEVKRNFDAVRGRFGV